MRVCIDGFNLALPKGTGVATYSKQLADVLGDNGYKVDGLYGLRTPFRKAIRDINFFEALGNQHETREYRKFSIGWPREIIAGFKTRKVREINQNGMQDNRQFERRLPAFDNLYTYSDLFDQATRNFKRFGVFTTIKLPVAPDIMHWTYPFPIRVKGAKNIYTMHDLVPLKLPFASLDNKRLYYKLMRACVKKGDHICTVSDASAADITGFFPEADGMVTNTYQAIEPADKFLTDPDELEVMLKSIFRLKKDGYFMFFGAIEPKKNVNRLIEAFLTSGVETPLVIVGRRAWGADEELRLIQKDEVQPLKTLFRNIKRIDYLPRRMLMQLVQGAKAVAFPSLYEGFGLPVLEAMNLGTPVITSNTSSLVEVAGKATMQVDPYKPAELAAAFKKLDQDSELRAKLSRDGIAQAGKFSANEYFKQLDAMYHKVLES